MNCQLRIRVDASFPDITYINDWLKDAQQGLAFEHDKPDNHHFHVYLFSLDRDVDAMRKRLGKHLPKECYAVGTTCAGKKKLKITLDGAYTYGTEKELNKPVWSKGITDETLAALAIKAADHYRPYPIVSNMGPPHEETTVIFKVDRVWERLSAKQAEYEGMTVRAIKGKLCAEWLNAGRALPRSADLHRYALSLYYLNKYKDTYIPDDALVGEYD